MEEQGSEQGAARDPEQDHVLLRALLDTSGLLVIVLDQDGVIRLFNRACERLTRLSSQEVLGKPIWSTLVPEDEVDDVRRIAERLGRARTTTNSPTTGSPAKANAA